MTKPGSSLWNRTHKTWTPSLNPRRCTYMQEGPCKATPIKGVTLCVQHALSEYKRISEGYFKAKATHDAFVDMVECLHEALKAQTVGDTGVTLAQVAYELDRIMPPKELRADVEDAMPLPARRGRPAIDRDMGGRTAYPRRRDNNVLANRPDLPQWTGHVSTPEEQEEEMRQAGFTGKAEFIKKDELLGEDSKDGAV